METDSFYRIVALRARPFSSPLELLQPTRELVRALGILDTRFAVLNTLSGLFKAVSISRPDGSDRLEELLANSAIGYPFDRDPRDPSHDLILFSASDDDQGLHLTIDFVVTNQPAEGGAPGLAMTLRLGAGAAAPIRSSSVDRFDKVVDGTAESAPNERGAHLQRLLEAVVQSCQVDVAYLELPGHPRGAIEQRPLRVDEFDVGALTYVAKSVRAANKAELEGAHAGVSAVPFANGSIVSVASRLFLEQHADVSAAIEAVRAVLHPPTPAGPTTPQVAAREEPFVRNAKPSYLLEHASAQVAPRPAPPAMEPPAPDEGFDTVYISPAMQQAAAAQSPVPFAPASEPTSRMPASTVQVSTAPMSIDELIGATLALPEGHRAPEPATPFERNAAPSRPPRSDK
jgi:hypothetical protein